MNQWNVKTMAVELKLTGNKFDWRIAWDVSEKSYKPGCIPFLDVKTINETCYELGYKDDICEGILSALMIIKQHPLLERLSWHYHCLLYGNIPDIPMVPEWPEIGKISDSESGLVQVVTLLSGIPRLKAFYNDRGIPLSILKDTLIDVEVWMRDYRTRRGEWGLSVFDWIVREMKGQILRLGRLQFEFKENGFFPIVVFRHPTDGVIALSEPDKFYREDGEHADVDNLSPGPDVWKSTLTEGQGWVEGYPISPTGHVVRKKIKLNTYFWKKIFSRTDPFLSVHIPAIGPMDMNACGKSYETAFEFFPKYFPEFKFKAFCCWSWLLDPMFEKCLPPESNTVRFLREYYLIPLPKTTDWSVFDRVFLCKPMDPRLIQRKTSMQKAIADEMEKGAKFRDHGFVFFKEDFNWGKAVYRNMKSLELLK